MYSKFMHMERA